ncbi:hypothetical protein [Actinosynnema sp. NPDC023587]|uniref:hypothetical protein n=1 Tax=Actinosynnema sp. NPDC023587 TaxID=3154695 RepID=UPI0033EBC18C
MTPLPRGPLARALIGPTLPGEKTGAEWRAALSDRPAADLPPGAAGPDPATSGKAPARPGG